jgi:hypothetical protein
MDETNMQLKEPQLLMLTFIWLVILICSKNITAINTSSSTATIYVDPQESIGIIGQNFTISIYISNVVDLYGWEFKLGWNATILDSVEVSEGSFLKSGGSTFFTYKTNNTLGYMIVDCTLLGQVPGVSGSGVLAAIKFHVKSIGECILDLYDTILVNSVEQAIEHISIDGYYYTSVHDIAITNLTASSTEVNVTIENQGTHTETFNVSAYYTRLSDPLIGTQTVTLTKGATTTLTFTWNPPSPGRYEIRAEATTVPEETDTADNIYKIIIQAGYSTSNLTSQTANSINGFHIALSIFVLTLAIMLPKALKNANRTQNYILPNGSNPKETSEMNIWQHLTLKQLNSLR